MCGFFQRGDGSLESIIVYEGALHDKCTFDPNNSVKSLLPSCLFRLPCGCKHCTDGAIHLVPGTRHLPKPTTAVTRNHTSAKQAPFSLV